MASEFDDGGQIKGFPKLGSNSRPCPHIRSGSDGTHWCALAERPAPSAEPVAWRFPTQHGWAYQEVPPYEGQIARAAELGRSCNPLYLHPQPDHREVMRMALEALERTSDWVFKDSQPEEAKQRRQAAIDALRAALGEGNE